MKKEFMEEAILLAKEAFSRGEVPVGAVIVKNGQVIGKGSNRCEEERDPTLHAEIIAIKEAVSTVRDQRLDGCEMYVTLEPCAMCSGAIINSRISAVYIAAKDNIYGAMGSVCSLQYYFPEKPNVEYGLYEEESKGLLKEFFGSLRKKEVNR